MDVVYTGVKYVLHKIDRIRFALLLHWTRTGAHVLHNQSGISYKNCSVNRITRKERACIVPFIFLGFFLFPLHYKSKKKQR